MIAPPVRPTRSALFLGFFSVGICGFGGVLPWARRMIVEQRRWLSAAEFTDMLSLCQFLPGPNIINVSVALGARFHGVGGALSAFAGLMAAPMAIVITLAMAQVSMVACRLLSETTVFLQPATLLRQPPHPRSTVPPQSPPRTTFGRHVVTLPAAQATSIHLVLHDPCAESEPPSQLLPQGVATTS